MSNKFIQLPGDREIFIIKDEIDDVQFYNGKRIGQDRKPVITGTWFEIFIHWLKSEKQKWKIDSSYSMWEPSRMVISMKDGKTYTIEAKSNYQLRNHSEVKNFLEELDHDRSKKA